MDNTSRFGSRARIARLFESYVVHAGGGDNIVVSNKRRRAHIGDSAHRYLRVLGRANLAQQR